MRWWRDWRPAIGGSDRWGGTGAGGRHLPAVLHGCGQTPDDTLRDVLQRIRLPTLHIRVPAAPEQSWYDTRTADPLTATTGVHLGSALELIEAEAGALIQTGIAPERIILAGFSQGACVAPENVS